MPPLLIIAALGAGTWLGRRWLRNKVHNIDLDRQKARKTAKSYRRTKSSSSPIQRDEVAELKKDPITGIYRLDGE